MIQPEWERRLELSLKSGTGRHWLAHLHLGIMRAERFYQAGARAAWRRSVASTPSVAPTSGEGPTRSTRSSS